MAADTGKQRRPEYRSWSYTLDFKRVTFACIRSSSSEYRTISKPGDKGSTAHCDSVARVSASTSQRQLDLSTSVCHARAEYTSPLRHRSCFSCSRLSLDNPSLARWLRVGFDAEQMAQRCFQILRYPATDRGRNEDHVLGSLYRPRSQRCSRLPRCDVSARSRSGGAELCHPQDMGTLLPATLAPRSDQHDG